MADLLAFDLPGAADRGAWLELVNPITQEVIGADDGEPARIHLKGADSMAYEEAVAHTVAMQGRRPQRRRQNPTVGEILEAAQENNQAQAEQLAKITIGWENIGYGVDDKGKPATLPFSHENAVRLYTEQRWVREQAIAFFSDRANFAGID